MHAPFEIMSLVDDNFQLPNFAIVIKGKDDSFKSSRCV